MKINRTAIDIIAAQKGLSMADIAQRAGLSRQSVSTIRTRGTSSAISAGKIARALDVDVTELIEDE